MKALVKTAQGAGGMEVLSIARPVAGPGQVVVAPRAVGVCGSDIHTWRATASWEVAIPVVLGHEMAGEVVQVGEGVSGWAVGDRVVCETNGKLCGRCRQCRTGSPQHCVDLKVTGAHVDGFFAEFAVVDAGVLHAIPEGLGWKAAAMAEPIAVAFTGVIQQGHVELGEDVVVIGLGAVGVSAARLARLAGARAVILVGTDRDRQRGLALQSEGIGTFVEVGRDDVKSRVAETMSNGADLVVDAAGASAALRTALDVVATGGRIVKIGWGPQPLGYSLDTVVEKAVSILGSRGHSWLAWERVLDLLARDALNAESMIGGEFDLDDWEAAFSEMESGNSIKSLINFP
jgi:alcohol dehydrogenase/L-iditol 2-dehydrogenase